MKFILILLLASSSAFGQQKDTSWVWEYDTTMIYQPTIWKSGGKTNRIEPTPSEWAKIVYITSKTLEEYAAYCYADSFRIPARQVPLSKRRGKKVVYAHREPTFADFIKWVNKKI